MSTYYLFREESIKPYRYYLSANKDDIDYADTIVLNEEDMNYVKASFESVKTLCLSLDTEYSRSELNEVIEALRTLKKETTCVKTDDFLNRLIIELKKVFDDGYGLYIDSNL